MHSVTLATTRKKSRPMPTIVSDGSVPHPGDGRLVLGQARQRRRPRSHWTSLILPAHQARCFSPGALYFLSPQVRKLIQQVAGGFRRLR